MPKLAYFSYDSGPDSILEYAKRSASQVRSLGQDCKVHYNKKDKDAIKDTMSLLEDFDYNKWKLSYAVVDTNTMMFEESRWEVLIPNGKVYARISQNNKLYAAYVNIDLPPHECTKDTDLYNSVNELYTDVNNWCSVHTEPMTNTLKRSVILSRQTGFHSSSGPAFLFAATRRRMSKINELFVRRDRCIDDATFDLLGNRDAKDMMKYFDPRQWDLIYVFVRNRTAVVSHSVWRRRMYGVDIVITISSTNKVVLIEKELSTNYKYLTSGDAYEFVKERYERMYKH